ncbi:GNAT family N-acetyltransferase [Halalkalicoccus sp. NIPERK01]|uniref:GNAT family N-acetyltransferase n=1 Tax=Halalkalicoccus sp. NIPERK01 TaxID=3053469 RepID=UPI00256ED336|nr:GNAT family N-acetyltransferase [Halalkalicoccus sp. NIPERK01]MDL5361463.1 GNAT family N-acetyltransferase [Halalkalicoccus sp. NIPERK01]
MEIRDATREDVDAIREVARQSLQTSYAHFLESETIDDAVEQWYGDGRLEELISDEADDVYIPVLEVDGEIVAFAQCYLVEFPERVGEIHWLHVDPDHRGEGYGSRLYDHARETFEADGIDRFKGFVFAENEPGNEFYERRGYESAYTHTQEIAGEEYTENVWVDIPEGEQYRRAVEPHENEEGETLYVAYREASVGSRGAFHVSYLDEDLERRYGWFCSVCESFDNAMDPSGRVVCNECGNVRKATRWDAAYL